MPDIQKLNEAKTICKTAGHCTEYQTLLQYENQLIDSHNANYVQSATIWGLIIGLIGLTILLTPFVKPVHRLQKFIMPKLAILSLIPVGIAAGYYLGFLITYSKCAYRSCSPLELYAIILIPLATLLFTIPLAIKIYRKRQAIVDKIDKPNAIVWIIIGLLIIAGATILTISRISDSKIYGETQKQYLLNSD